MTVMKKVIAARTSLILDYPFWGVLALHLKLVEDPGCGTAWTDGRNLGVDPKFIESLSHDQVVALIGHETMHCAMGHPWRRETRSPYKWNAACDRAINGELQAAGFKLPPDGEMPDATEKGKSAEWIFAHLPQDPPQPQGGQQPPQQQGQQKPQKGAGRGAGQGQKQKPQPQGKQGQQQAAQGQQHAPCTDPLGEVRDAPTTPDDDGTPAPTEQTWKERATEAMVQAKMMGKLPGGMERQVQQALKPRIDIRSLLLRFFSERATGDYSWRQPNRRYISQGLYLPSLYSQELGEVAVMVDTSGSIGTVALQYAKGILEQVLDEVNPAGVTLYFVDTKVHRIHRMERGEPLTWEPKGGGGTSFVSFFRDVEQGEIQPVCVVGITDLCACFPKEVPSVPVLWLTDQEHGTAPFGEVVFVDR